MEESKFYFYVLECADGSFYGGYSVDVKRRLQEHNSGKGAKYTRSRTPVKLLYYECFETKSKAMSAEYHFKKLSRKKKEAFLKEYCHSEYTKKLSEG
ncbi:GIY-YIG nuclease family protein [Bacillus andreraoultii]|uniref:GIY-YIG nuclease family protein n=1 Tax=Bacillus andreraoultii TaxID=1499685 RepID=UPI000539A511|nr:GIY-YIG nuclease family protein [Bacillus andreraoultii]